MNRIIALGLPAILFLASSGASFGQAPAAAWTLEQCLDRAYATHPLLRASDYDVAAAEARIRQAKALNQPSLEIDQDLQPRLLDFKNGGESYWGVSQTFGFPGKRKLRGDIAGREADEVRSDRESLRLDVAFEVKEAFFSLLLAEELVRNAEQDRGLASDFLDRAQAKFAAGDAAEMEVVRARVESAKAANTLRAAENARRLARARLNMLIGRGLNDPLNLVGAFRRNGWTPPEVDISRKAFAARPELRKLLLASEREGLRERLAGMDVLPDLTLGVSRHNVVGEGKTWDMTFSIPIPLFFWQAKTGPGAEARAARQAADEQAEALRRRIALEVEAASADARNAGEQISLYEKEILVQAEEGYQKFLFSYQQGEIGGIELIEARRTLLEARRAYADALFTFNVALAALERAVGAPLEKESHE